MTTAATLTPELTTPCPDWCAHTETCDPASVEEGGGGMWHQSAVTVVSTAEHSGVSARLELFDTCRGGRRLLCTSATSSAGQPWPMD